MVIKPMLLILNVCYLKEDQTSDNGDFVKFLFQSTMDMPKHAYIPLTKMKDLICTFHGSLTACQGITKSFNSFQRSWGFLIQSTLGLSGYLHVKFLKTLT